MLPLLLEPSTGLPIGVKEQAESESQACGCTMGRDEEQMSHHETGYPAMPQSLLAQAPG